MMLGWLYAAVFVTGMLMADLNNLVVFHLGGLKLLGVDLVDYTALLLAALVVLGGATRCLSRSGRLFLVFLAWLALEVGLGFSRYAFSAIGEFRYVAPLFWFFVPIAVDGLRRTDETKEGGTMVLQIIWVAAAAGLVMLVIELAHGGRVFLTARNQEVLTDFTDFRGIRYLDTYQTFNIALAASALLLRGTGGQWRRRDLWIAGALALAALWTRNRAAIIALSTALIALGMLERRFRLVLRVTIGALVVIAAVSLLSSTMIQQVTSAFSGVLNPAEDATGQWRLLLQLEGIRQGLEAPILGHGYGGYYLFEIPGLAPVLAPPHNQYIELFMKGGLIAVLLCLLALSSYGRALWKLRSAEPLHETEALSARIVLVVLLSQVPYALAYDFPPIFGLLLGCAEVILQRHRARLADLARSERQQTSLTPAPA